MRELKVLTGERVVISTAVVELRGVIESVTRSFVALVDAQDVSGASPKPITGFVLVPTRQIAYVQAVG